MGKVLSAIIATLQVVILNIEDLICFPSIKATQNIMITYTVIVFLCMLMYYKELMPKYHREHPNMK